MNEIEPQLLYDADTIRQKVSALAQEIDRDHATDDLLIVSLAGGSIIFLADLVRAIQRPVRYEFVQVQYSFSESREDRLDIQFPISLDVEGQTLVVIKDVVGTGVVDSYVRNQFQRRGAREVQFAALLDVPELRRTSFEVDYRVFTPRRTGIFVGYGLKDRGRYGNLDYIGLLPGA